MLFEQGTIALVTGAGRGIGGAIAKDLAREGATVAVNYNQSDEAAKRVVANIESEGHQAIAVQADVSDEKAVKQMFRRLRDEFGHLDVVVNNAGIVDDGFLMMMSLRKFESVLRVNLLGTFICSREALKMMARERKGSIVNIASVSGMIGMEGQLNYSASKGGIIAFTKGLAREAAPQGVRANVVAPGFIETDMIKRVPPPLMGLYTQLIPLQRIGRPEEVACAVSFVASPKASYMTGGVLVVDGGLGRA